MTNQHLRSDLKDFWEETIKDWDANRHGANKKAMPLLYRLTHTPSAAVRFRKHVVLEHLKEHVKGKRVIELGCGTGRISQQIIECGAISYLGYDIADNAVAMAQQSIENSSTDGRIRFQQSDIGELPPLDADFIFSMGLFPWLKDEQINHLFAISGKADFLHTSNERGLNLRQKLRGLHQRLTGTEKYQVTLRNADIIFNTAQHHGWKHLYVFRHKNLATLSCLSSLPFPDHLGTQKLFGTSPIN